MPKIILLGDIHFKAKVLEDIHDAWLRLISFAKNNKVDLILQAGDVFDCPNIHSKEHDVGTIHHAFSNPLYTAGIPFLAITGNHDIGRPMDKDALATIETIPNVLVVRQPSLVDVSSIGGPKNVSIATLPWLYFQHVLYKLKAKGVEDAEDKVKNLRQLIVPKITEAVAKEKEKGNFVILLGHLEVSGAKLNDKQCQMDGSYEFSPMDLAKIKADVYALGHIHIRQHIQGLPNANDGYLGTLCQTSYKECGNSTGFRLLTVEDGKIKEDQFIENSHSPKYFKVDSLDGLLFRKNIDKVLVSAAQKPVSLPEGVEFQKKPVIKEERDDGYGLNCDTSIDDLLKVWKEANKCKLSLDVLISKAKELTSNVSLGVDSIGSLEKINRVYLKNITCHTETTLDLSNVKGVCGVEGNNGSGKTTAMEAILLGFYGTTPSRPYLPSLISQGCTAQGVVEIDFTSHGKKYNVHREMKNGKTFSHKALLNEEGSPDPIAGPKVEEVNSSCSQIVGEKDLVLAGIFSSQGEAGNILELRPAERKDVFAKLLGTDKFLTLSDLAKKKAAAGNTEIETSTFRLEQLHRDISTEAQDISNLAETNKKIADSKKNKEDAESNLALATESLNELQAFNKKRIEQLDKIKKVDAKIEEIKKQAKKEKDKKEELEKLPSEKSLATEIKKIKKAEEELEELREEARKITEQKNQVLVHVGKTKDLYSKAIEERSVKYSVYTRNLGQVRERANKEYSEKKNSLLVLKAEKEKELQGLKSSLEKSNKKAALVEGIPNQAICTTCPLAKDGLTAKSEIVDAQTKIAELEKEISEISNEAFAKLKEPKHEKELSVEEFDIEADKQIKAYSASISETETKAAGIGPTDEMRKKAQSIQAIIAQKPGIEKQAEIAKTASVDIAKIEGTIASLRKQFEELQKEKEEIEVDDEKDEGPTTFLVKNLQKQIKETEDKISALIKDQGRLEQILETHNKKKTEITTLEKSTESVRTETDVLNTLNQAFGRDGIPQLIVDSTIPHFEDIMTRLIADFDGSWEIQVKSQKTSKSGNTQEVIDIIVDDGNGPREISTYSGGEKKLLKAIIRIAFSTLQAERSGKGLKVMVLDEATDGMDGEVAPNYISMLSKLSCFNQIFVVTHNERDLSTFSQTISFSRKNGHSTTVVLKGVAG